MSLRNLRVLAIVLILGLLLLPAAAFADHELDAVHGTVFHDLNQDGIFDVGEVGIAGVAINLLDDTDAVIATAVTLVDGFYEFSGLSPGSYTVVELNPVDYVSTTPDEVPFILGGVEFGPTVDFGDVPVVELGSISGTVYDDLNRSRLFDTGDVGLENVMVNLKDSEGLLVSSAATDSDGNYAFTDLLPGSYTVREEDPEGYYSTTAHEVSVTLLAGDVVVDVNFGDFIPEEGEISPIDLPITRFFDLPLLDILEMRSIDGFGYGNIAKVYFLAYLGDMTVQEILDLYNTGMGWGNIMKEALGKAGLKGYNLGLIMSGREVPNQVQKTIDGCPIVDTQEQVQELMGLGANQGTLKKLCKMVMEEGLGYDELVNAVKSRSEGMKWKDIQTALENPGGGAAESGQDNGPPACKGKNKNDPGCVDKK